MKFLVRAHMKVEGSVASVYKAGTSFLQNTPYITRTRNVHVFEPSHIALYNRQEDKFGSEAHVWMPDTYFGVWSAFTKLIQNLNGAVPKSISDEFISVDVNNENQLHFFDFDQPFTEYLSRTNLERIPRVTVFLSIISFIDIFAASYPFDFILTEANALTSNSAAFFDLFPTDSGYFYDSNFNVEYEDVYSTESFDSWSGIGLTPATIDSTSLSYGGSVPVALENTALSIPVPGPHVFENATVTFATEDNQAYSAKFLVSADTDFALRVIASDANFADGSAEADLIPEKISEGTLTTQYALIGYDVAGYLGSFTHTGAISFSPGDDLFRTSDDAFIGTVESTDVNAMRVYNVALTAVDGEAFYTTASAATGTFTSDLSLEDFREFARTETFFEFNDAWTASHHLDHISGGMVVNYIVNNPSVGDYFKSRRSGNILRVTSVENKEKWFEAEYFFTAISDSTRLHIGLEDGASASTFYVDDVRVKKTYPLDPSDDGFVGRSLTGRFDQNRYTGVYTNPNGALVEIETPQLPVDSFLDPLDDFFDPERAYKKGHYVQELTKIGDTIIAQAERDLVLLYFDLTAGPGFVIGATITESGSSNFAGVVESVDQVSGTSGIMVLSAASGAPTVGESFSDGTSTGSVLKTGFESYIVPFSGFIS